jgi:ferredoxin
MIAAEQNTYHAYLEKHNEANWAELLQRLLPSVHPVDQAATQIWFSFWPLKLSRALRQAEDPQLVMRQFLLDGKYRLEEQIDSTVSFLYGVRFWPEVKRAILKHTEEMARPEGTPLEQQIRQVASQVAGEKKAPESVVMGITLVGFMILQQVGVVPFSEVVNKPSTRPRNTKTADQVLSARNRERKGGVWSFLHGREDRRFVVTFEENREGCAFKAIRGQDLSMASATDPRDYITQDPRRTAGPIPAQCRSGACGYCWIGVLGGKERLSPLTPFERRRLRHFGYASNEIDGDLHPHVRLACQAKCYGEVSIVIPPWNGVLDGRE